MGKVLPIANNDITAIPVAYSLRAELIEVLQKRRKCFCQKWKIRTEQTIEILI